MTTDQATIAADAAQGDRYARDVLYLRETMATVNDPRHLRTLHDLERRSLRAWQERKNEKQP